MDSFLFLCLLFSLFLSLSCCISTCSSSTPRDGYSPNNTIGRYTPHHVVMDLLITVLFPLLQGDDDQYIMPSSGLSFLVCHRC
uniref:Putative secreted protein n=1 Tax=Anopheles triannulatus TaxID=58253 RepID=A0A2M4B0X7_9DIPT